MRSQNWLLLWWNMTKGEFTHLLSSWKADKTMRDIMEISTTAHVTPDLPWLWLCARYGLILLSTVIAIPRVISRNSLNGNRPVAPTLKPAWCYSIKKYSSDVCNKEGRGVFYEDNEIHCDIERIVHPQMEILLSFSHLHVPSLYDFISSLENKTR